MQVTFEQKMAQENQHQYEKQVMRERTLLNVDKCYQHQARRQAEQNAKQREIDDRVMNALANKDKKLDEKRQNREGKA